MGLYRAHTDPLGPPKTNFRILQLRKENTLNFVFAEKLIKYLTNAYSSQG